jgi:hypothetical protein
MPEPTRVWMVRLGRNTLQEVPGSIAIDGTDLVFEAEDGSFERRLAFTTIRKAKRVRGSPVLIIAQEEGQTAFYFTQPPPLEPAPASGERDRLSPLSQLRGGRRSKRKHVRTNATYLSASNVSKKEEVKAWLDAISERIGSPEPG